MNQWPSYRFSIMSLITNINLSGLHPIDAFMRYMNYMGFMKSGKYLAKSLPHPLIGGRVVSHNPTVCAKKMP